MSETAPPSPPAPRSVINRVVTFGLRQPWLVALLTAILVVAGVWSLQRLPVDAYPDLSPPMVELITQWPGHAAEEVERLITVPSEVEMNGLPNATVTRSISLYGLSDLVITYKDGTDRNAARQEVFNRLGDLSLPDGVKPSVTPLTSPSGLIYRYVLQSSDRSPMELKTFEDWVVEPAFKSIQGVADDSGFGGGEMQYQVLFDPEKLAGVGLSASQVTDALAANNANAGGGFYSQGGQFYYIRGDGRLTSLEDIGEVVLAVHDGVPVTVKDIGRVEVGIAPRLGEFGYEDQDDAVGGTPAFRIAWRAGACPTPAWSTCPTTTSSSLAPSTRMPKSIAPIESRLAEAFWTLRQVKAKSSDSGIVTATISPARKSYRKKISITTTSSMPRMRLPATTSVVSLMRSVRS